jgi:uncharacterized protein (DUF58 family)
MSDVWLLDSPERRISPATEGAALDLAARLPSLIIAAKEIASSVMHGVHGRRVAGAGETFWQFRPFVAGESTAAIDWRRSARDDRLYIREREWEGAHTIWIWIDRSPSMGFISKLALQSKVDRALVLGLAAADLLVQGGERVGLIGLTRPVATRGIVARFAQALLAEERSPGFVPAELPVSMTLPPRTQSILISDFLSDPVDITEKIRILSARGARGHLVMIADPVEETFPFTGHTEFVDVDSNASLRLGQAESFRSDYIARLAAHREAVMTAARRRGWSFLPHRTDRPASEALLALRMRLEADLDGPFARVAV